MTDPGGPEATTALVVVREGGGALRDTLSALAWAERRCLLDPAGVLGPGASPPGTEPWTDVATPGWTLLVIEGERPAAGLAGALRAAPRDAARAYRVAIECEAFGGAIRLRGQPIRLVHGRVPAVRVSLGGEIGFATNGAAAGAGMTIGRPLGALPVDAVEALNADATALAALAAAAGTRPGVLRLVAAGTVGATRVLLGAGRGRLGWGRWIASVMAGYRGLLVEAKLWERRHLGGTPT